MAQQKKKNSFVLQAGILAAAGIIVKIIGLLYRSPLTSIIGLEGNGYYSSAINIYTIILLISSYSIPSAISKVIAQRLAYKEYRNAQRVFQCALIYVVVVGGAASLFAFFAAPVLVEDNAVMVLRVFAPTIFFSGLLGVLRGYFQAHGTMMHTSLSQILEQILNAVVSILAAYLLMKMAAGENATKQAIYGASGSALGTGIGVLTALLFMFLMYRLNSSVIRKRVERDKTEKIETYGEIFKVIITIVTPFILSTFVYNCSTSVNMKIYYKIMMDVAGLDEATVAIQYGIFATQAISVVNIPIAISSAMSSASIPGVASSYAIHHEKETRRKVSQAIRMTMLIAIPASVGLMVLAQPIMQFIFPQKEALETASNLLCVLSVTVILFCLSTLTNAVLQGIGKVNIPVINAVIALAVQIGVLIGLLLYTDLGLYSLACANIAYSLLMCILNHLAVRRYLDYREEVGKTFIKPGIAAIGMGVVAYGVFSGVNYVLKISRISLLIAIGFGVVVYFVLIMKLGVVNEAELKAFPKGNLLVHIAKKFHLLREEEESVSEKTRKRKKKRKKRRKKRVVRKR